VNHAPDKNPRSGDPARRKRRARVPALPRGRQRHAWRLLRRM